MPRNPQDLPATPGGSNSSAPYHPAGTATLYSAPLPTAPLYAEALYDDEVGELEADIQAESCWWRALKVVTSVLAVASLFGAGSSINRRGNLRASHLDNRSYDALAAYPALPESIRVSSEVSPNSPLTASREGSAEEGRLEGASLRTTHDFDRRLQLVSVGTRLPDISMYAGVNTTFDIPLATFVDSSGAYVSSAGFPFLTASLNDDDPIPSSVRFDNYNASRRFYSLPMTSFGTSTYPNTINSVSGRKASNVAIVNNIGYVAATNAIYLRDFTAGRAPVTLVPATASLTRRAGLSAFTPFGTIIENFGGRLHMSMRLQPGNEEAYGIFDFNNASALNLIGYALTTHPIHRIEPYADYTLVQTSTSVLAINTTNPQVPFVAFELNQNNFTQVGAASFQMNSFFLKNNKLAISIPWGIQLLNFSSDPLRAETHSKILPTVSRGLFKTDVVLLNQTMGIFTDDNNGLFILEFSDSANPVLISQLLASQQEPSGLPRSIDIIGNRLFFIGAQVYIYDISDVRDIKLLAQYPLLTLFPAIYDIGYAVQSQYVVRRKVEDNRLILTVLSNTVQNICIIDATSGDIAHYGQFTFNPGLGERGQTTTIKLLARLPGTTAIERFDYTVLARAPQYRGPTPSRLQTQVMSTTTSYFPALSRLRTDDLDSLSFSVRVDGQVSFTTIAAAAIRPISLSDFNSSIWRANNTISASLVPASNQSLLVLAPFRDGLITHIFDLYTTAGQWLATYDLAFTLTLTTPSALPLDPDRVLFTAGRGAGGGNVSLLTRSGSSYTTTLVATGLPRFGLAICDQAVYWSQSGSEQRRNMSQYFVKRDQCESSTDITISSPTQTSTTSYKGYTILGGVGELYRFLPRATAYDPPYTPTATYTPPQAQRSAMRIVRDTMILAQDNVGLLLVDLKNVPSFRLISQLPIENIGRTYVLLIHPDDATLAFIASDLGLTVVDIADHERPILLYTLTFPAPCMSVAVIADQAWVSIQGRQVLQLRAPGGDWHNSHALTYTAQKATQGEHTLTIRATNPFGDFADYTSPWTVANRVPYYNTSLALFNQTWETGSFETYVITPFSESLILDGDDDAITYRARSVDASGVVGPLSPFLTFFAAPGQPMTLSGAFPQKSVRTGQIEVTGTDSSGASASVRFSLTNPYRPPVCLQYGNQTMAAGTVAVPGSGLCSDPNGYSLRYTLVSVGPGISATVDDSSGTVSVNTLPRGQGVSRYIVRVTKVDGLGALILDAAAAVNNTGFIRYTNTPPSVDSEELPEAKVGEAYSATLPAAVDVDGDILSDTLNGLPSGFTYNSSTRTVTGRSFVDTTKQLTRRVNDGFASAIQPYSFSVVLTLTAELAATSFIYTEDQVLVLGPLLNLALTGTASAPTNVSVSLTVAKGSYRVSTWPGVTSLAPRLDTLSFTGTPFDVAVAMRNITFEPPLNEVGSFTGGLVVSYGFNPTRNFPLSFSGIAVDDPITVPTQNMRPITVTPLQRGDGTIPNFGNPDGNVLRYTVEILNTNGTLVVSSANAANSWTLLVDQVAQSFSFTPLRDTQNSYLIRATAQALDALSAPVAGKSASTSTTLTVANTAPRVTGETLAEAKLGEPFAHQFSAANDEDGDSFTDSFSLPAGFTYYPSNRTLSGVPTNTMLGTSFLTRTVSDGRSPTIQVYFLTTVATLRVNFGQTSFVYTEDSSLVFGEPAAIQVEGTGNPSLLAVLSLVNANPSTATLTLNETLGLSKTVSQGALTLRAVPSTLTAALRSLTLLPRTNYDGPVSYAGTVTYGENTAISFSLGFSGNPVDHPLTPPLIAMLTLSGPPLQTISGSVPAFGNLDENPLRYWGQILLANGSILSDSFSVGNPWGIAFQLGSFSFVPPRRSQANYVWRLIAQAMNTTGHDILGKSSFAETSLTVTNIVPSLLTETLAGAEVGIEYTRQLASGIDPDGDPLTDDFIDLAPSFRYNLTTRELRGRPTSSMIGTIPFTRQISDGRATATQTYFLTTSKSLDMQIAEQSFTYIEDRVCHFGEAAGIDIQGGALPVTVYITNANPDSCRLQVNATTGLTFDDRQSGSFMLSGSKAIVNTALRSLRLIPKADGNGPINLNMLVIDGANVPLSSSFSFLGTPVEDPLGLPVLPMANLNIVPLQMGSGSIPAFENPDLNTIVYSLDIIASNGTVIASTANPRGWSLSVNQQLATYAVVAPAQTQGAYTLRVNAQALDGSGIPIAGKTNSISSNLNVGNIAPSLLGSVTDQVVFSGRSFSITLPGATSPVGNSIVVRVETTTGGAPPTWITVTNTGANLILSGTVPRDADPSYNLVALYDDLHGGVVRAIFTMTARIGLTARNEADSFLQNTASTTLSSFEANYEGDYPLTTTLKIPRQLGEPRFIATLNSVIPSISFDSVLNLVVWQATGAKELVNAHARAIGFNLTQDNPGTYTIEARFNNGVDPLVVQYRAVTIVHVNQAPSIGIPFTPVTLTDGDPFERQVVTVTAFDDSDLRGNFGERLTVFNNGSLPAGIAWEAPTQTYRGLFPATGSYSLTPCARDTAGLSICNPISVTVNEKINPSFLRSAYERFQDYQNYVGIGATLLPFAYYLLRLVKFSIAHRISSRQSAFLLTSTILERDAWKQKHTHEILTALRITLIEATHLMLEGHKLDREDEEAESEEESDDETASRTSFSEEESAGTAAGTGAIVRREGGEDAANITAVTSVTATVPGLVVLSAKEAKERKLQDRLHKLTNPRKAFNEEQLLEKAQTTLRSLLKGIIKTVEKDHIAKADRRTSDDDKPKKPQRLVLFQRKVACLDRLVAAISFTDPQNKNIPRGFEDYVLEKISYVGTQIRGALIDGDSDEETQNLTQLYLTMVEYLFYIKSYQHRQIEVDLLLTLLSNLLATPGIKIPLYRKLINKILCRSRSEESLPIELKLTLKTTLATLSRFTNDDSLLKILMRLTSALQAERLVFTPLPILWQDQIERLRFKSILALTNVDRLIEFLNSYLTVSDTNPHLLQAYQTRLDYLNAFCNSATAEHSLIGFMVNTQQISHIKTLLEVALDTRRRMFFIINSALPGGQRLSRKINTSEARNGFATAQDCLAKLVAAYEKTFAVTRNKLIEETRLFYVAALTQIAKQHPRRDIRLIAFNALNNRGKVVTYTLSESLTLFGRGLHCCTTQREHKKHNKSLAMLRLDSDSSVKDEESLTHANPMLKGAARKSSMGKLFSAPPVPTGEISVGGALTIARHTARAGAAGDATKTVSTPVTRALGLTATPVVGSEETNPVFLPRPASLRAGAGGVSRHLLAAASRSVAATPHGGAEASSERMPSTIDVEEAGGSLKLMNPLTTARAGR